MANYFPISLILQGKQCTVVGGGTIAERKVLGLLQAGARTIVISLDLTPELELLREADRIEHIARCFEEGDLAEAFLVVAATDDAAVNEAVFAEARRQRVLVNIVDDPAHCDFALPAVLRRGDLTIAVGTNGRSPALARRIRDDFASCLRTEYMPLLELAAEVRDDLRRNAKRVSGNAWRRALDEALVLAQEGALEAARDRLSKLEHEEPEEFDTPLAANPLASHDYGDSQDSDLVRRDRDRAMVSLVGAGPGDPGLITVRGLERLRAAEVVFYDRLVDRRLLTEAPAGAELIYVGKVASCHVVRQTEINVLLVAAGKAGKRVVRLKGGDPFVFGRGAEEAEALAAAGIPFEVVPGVSSAVAVPAYAGIPVTHRQFASSFVVITGHEDPSKPAATIDYDWAKLATGVDTIVCLMAATNLPRVVERLVGHGRSPETPVALIRWGTWPCQKTLVGTLGDIVPLAAGHGFGPPSVAVIGEVVRLRKAIRWFDDAANDADDQASCPSRGEFPPSEPAQHLA